MGFFSRRRQRREQAAFAAKNKQKLIDNIQSDRAARAARAEELEREAKEQALLAKQEEAIVPEKEEENLPVESVQENTQDVSAIPQEEMQEIERIAESIFKRALERSLEEQEEIRVTIEEATAQPVEEPADADVQTIEEPKEPEEIEPEEPEEIETREPEEIESEVPEGERTEPENKDEVIPEEIAEPKEESEEPEEAEEPEKEGPENDDEVIPGEITEPETEEITEPETEETEELKEIEPEEPEIEEPALEEAEEPEEEEPKNDDEVIPEEIAEPEEETGEPTPEEIEEPEEEETGEPTPEEIEEPEPEEPEEPAPEEPEEPEEPEPEAIEEPEEETGEPTSEEETEELKEPEPEAIEEPESKEEETEEPTPEEVEEPEPEEPEEPEPEAIEEPESEEEETGEPTPEGIEEPEPEEPEEPEPEAIEEPEEPEEPEPETEEEQCKELIEEKIEGAVEITGEIEMEEMLEVAEAEVTEEEQEEAVVVTEVVESEEEESEEIPEDDKEKSDKKGKKGKGKKKRKMAYRCYDNRELSWLKFNTRVLEEAEDAKNPFCERLSFASIFQSNLDEFFMVRVGSLYDQMLVSDEIRDNKTNMTCKEQLLAIFEQVKLLTQRKDAAYAMLEKGLEEYGVQIASFAEMDKQDAIFLEAYFEHEIRPLLSPIIVSRKQPFPFLKNKEIYAVVILGKKDNPRLGIVPCNTDVVPRLIRVPGHENKFILMEDLILHYMDRVFEHYEIKGKSLIRIIRNADIDPDEEMYDDDTDFRQVMERLVSRRRKLAPIKLEYTRLMDEVVISELCKSLGLKKKQAFHSDAPLDMSFFSTIRDILRSNKELFYGKYSPQPSADFEPGRSVLEQIEEKDRFLFYPYEQIQPFLDMLNEAAEDPDVISMKMTLYRVANDSKVVDALIRAAENGKDVDVLVELRARFDEENNIGWSRRLEDAGCHILYGLDKLKVHSKLCLITKLKDDKISYITQIGTGNYNEKTAKLYTDFAVMTANQEIGAEANEVFRRLYLGQVMEETTHLMVAPKCLRNKILDKIDIQIERAKNGEPGYVGAKMNSLTDKRIIEKLIEASQAGVKIELVVRGACCLIGGIQGVTENITVRSLVGRYLEHSRIYIFGEDDVYIASADFMTRNTTRRVEVATPIYDEDIKRRVLKIFRTNMKDNVKARIQLADGHYVHVQTVGEPLNAQEYFQIPENR